MCKLEVAFAITAGAFTGAFATGVSTGSFATGVLLCELEIVGVQA